MEIGPTRALIDAPRHPYTEALLSAVPEPGVKRRERIVLTGDMPNPADPPSGCVFRTRCRHALPACAVEPPPLRMVGPEHHTACIRDDLYPSHTAPPARVIDRKVPVSAGG
jgi:oligopeptide/dipeptide ABC transporter ATP-binding protein